MPNILLSSIGRRVELARGFRAAYSRLGLEGQLCGTDIDRLAPALQVIDERRLIPAYDQPGYIDAVLQTCSELSVDVLFPLNDGEIEGLSLCKQEFAAQGTRLAVVDPPAADICNDKWRSYHLFKKLGLPVPKSWRLCDLPPIDEMVFPLFIKPRRGSAGVDAHRVDNPTQLKFFSEYVHDPIIQHFLPGPEITTDVICRLDGEVMATVSRQRIAVRGGEAIKSVTIADPRIDEACREIAKQLPARGPITVQCMMRNDVPHFIEINARLGGGVPLAIAAGVDVPALLLADAGGLDISGLECQPRTSVYMTRCDESFFLSEQSVEHPQIRHL